MSQRSRVVEKVRKGSGRRSGVLRGQKPVKKAMHLDGQMLSQVLRTWPQCPLTPKAAEGLCALDERPVVRFSVVFKGGGVRRFAYWLEPEGNDFRLHRCEEMDRVT